MGESLIFTGFGIEQRLRSFARLITQDFNLKVKFQGEVASLSKDWMQIPPLKDTPEAFLRAKFYVSHECGHALHSDFSIIEKARKEDKRLPAILNSLEDARIEKLMIGEFPGLERDMNENIQAIIASWDISNMQLATQLIYGIYLLGRDYDVSIFNTNAQKLLYELKDEIVKASVADDCQKVLKQARLILKKIDNLIQKQKEEKSDEVVSQSCERVSRSPERSEGEASPNQSDTQASSQQESFQTADEENENEGLNESDEGTEPLLSEAGKQELIESDFSSSSISDLIKAHFDEVKLEKDYDGMQNYEFLKDENNLEEETIQTPQEGDLSEYQRLLAPLLFEYNVLKRELEKIVSQRRTKKRRMSYKQGQAEGVIDTKRIWKIATKENNLFKKRKTGEAKTLTVDPDSLAIYILLDESGSMEHKERIEYAKKTAIIFAETLNSLKIPFALTGYTVEQSRLVRICYKEFSDDYRMVRSRLLSIQDRDGTFTAEHLPFAKRRLERRKERKKLLIVITDATDIESEVRLKRAMHQLKDTGILVIGIGIHTNLMADYYEKFIEIERIEGFAKELLSLLKTILSR